MKMRLTAIQRFCLHDGPGIRTTVFLKGCTLRCPWCSNPENISYEIQTGKSKTVYGLDMDIDEIVRICLKDKAYYEENGGVTVSGGEALLQADEVAVLFDKLHSENIGCCIETSLMAPVENLNKLIDITDYWFVDMKLLDAANASSAGSTLSNALCVFDFFPIMVLQMISVGEEMGDTPRMLLNVAEYYENEARREAAKKIARKEPISIAVMAVVVLFLLLSMLTPLLKFFELVKTL